VTGLVYHKTGLAGNGMKPDRSNRPVRFDELGRVGNSFIVAHHFADLI